VTTTTNSTLTDFVANLLVRSSATFTSRPRHKHYHHQKSSSPGTYLAKLSVSILEHHYYEALFKAIITKCEQNEWGFEKLQRLCFVLLPIFLIKFTNSEYKVHEDDQKDINFENVTTHHTELMKGFMFKKKKITKFH